MDLRNLNTFIQVAELSSFSRAGEKLGYSQPTISVQIKQLEEELGVKLFDRIGHAVRLTEQGRETLLYAQRICHMCQEMTQETGRQKEIRSVIRMGMGDSLCSALLGKGISELQENYPHIALNVSTAGTYELLRLLNHNEVDLVYTLDSHNYNANYIIASEEKIGVHFVVSADNPLAQHDFLTKEDLLTQQFLLTEKGMSYRRLLDEWMARDSMEIQPILEIGSADLICKLVEKGVGMSFLPDYVSEAAVRKGTVVRLDAQGFEPELWKQLLYHRDKWVSIPMQAVLNHFADIQLNEKNLEKEV